MQIRTVAASAFDTKAEWGIRGNRSQAQPGKKIFGGECKVTISQEGKRLSQQQNHAEASVRDTRAERMLLRQQKQSEQDKKVKERYREELKEIEDTLHSLNNTYDKTEDTYTIEREQEVLKAMRDQKQLQMEENQRQARDAQKMAMQIAGYQEDIDENNRDMLTLLKSLEEAEKTEDEQENGEGKKKSNDSGGTGTGSLTSDVIHDSALQFTLSSVKREWDVQEAIAGLGEEGHRLFDTANAITRNILRESQTIKAALEDENITDEKRAEMMKSFQEGMTLNYRNIEDYRRRGLQIQEDAQECRIKHIADNPLAGIQETKRSMILSAADSACNEAMQGRLGEASQEIKDEIEKLIDARNDVDRTQHDEEVEAEEQAEGQDEILEL